MVLDVQGYASYLELKFYMWHAFFCDLVHNLMTTQYLDPLLFIRLDDHDIHPVFGIFF